MKTSLPEIRRSPILDIFDRLEERCLKGDLTLEEIINLIGRDGHFVLILFFTLPFMQPVPLIGLSTPFGLIIGTLGWFFFFNCPPWIPHKWKTKTLSSKLVSSVAEGAERCFEKIENLTHPRWQWFFRKGPSVISLIVLSLSALLLALPLPLPFSNTIPAFTILLVTIAFLERDGLFIILSYATFVAALVYFGGVAMSLDFLIEKVKPYLFF